MNANNFFQLIVHWPLISVPLCSISTLTTNLPNFDNQVVNFVQIRQFMHKGISLLVQMSCTQQAIFFCLFYYWPLISVPLCSISTLTTNLPNFDNQVVNFVHIRQFMHKGISLLVLMSCTQQAIFFCLFYCYFQAELTLRAAFKDKVV